MKLPNTSNAAIDPYNRIELNNYMNDLSGIRSGKLVALWPNSKHPKYSHVFWTCLCDCGNYKVVLSSNFKRGLSTSCGCSWIYNSGKNNGNWCGYKGLSGSAWNKIRTSAKKRNIEFNISIKDAWDLFIKQNKRCALTGVELNLPEWDAYRNRYNASLDRIDSSRPYDIDNIQWVHKDVNRMKIDLPLERLFELCKLIVDYNNL